MKSSVSAAENSSPKGIILTAPLGFLSLALLWCQVGYLTPTFSRALGGILWLLTVYLTVRDKRLLWLLLSALLLFNPIGAVHRPEGLWLLGLLPWAGGAWGKRWMGAAWIAALGGWIWANAPGFWVPLDDFAASSARWLTGANLSSSAAGLPLLALALCFPVAMMLSERKFFVGLVTIGGLILALLVFWLLQRPLENWLHYYGLHGLHDAFNMQWAPLILLGVVLFIWGYLIPPVVKNGGAARMGSVILLPAAVLTGSLFMGWPPTIGSPSSKQVVFYNKGYLNWDVPVYGYYGPHASGMFGLIPDYLRWRGFTVGMTDSLSADALDSAGVVVFINLMDPLSPEEDEELRGFVDRGGSVLLLGDHTGMANIREPSNRLLEPYCIELNFDSAKPLRTGWIGSLVCPQHPLTERLGLLRQGGDRAGVTQIWIGASLGVSPPGKPLIVGRDGFSDWGNEQNEKDGYLGDFRYRINERLGNLVLLAEARRGQGKVLVFGDTSTLQNGALVRAGNFVVKTFDYLLSPVKSPPLIFKILGVLLIILAALAWFRTRGSQTALALGALALFVGAGLSQQRVAAAGDFPNRPWTNDANPRAIIDHSHSPCTPLNQVSVDGHWGLQNCLMRSGFLPQIMERWDGQTVKDARILVEFAPARAFSGKQKQNLSDFMQKGGLVILSCGMEEFDGSKSLLKDYGLEPIYVPLGPAELETEISLPAPGDNLTPTTLNDTTNQEVRRSVTVTFHKAWETKVNNQQAQVLLEGYGKPIIVFAPVGEGGLLYIPDTDFLTNLNLERPSGDYNEGNILYLRHLLKELAGGK